MAGAVMAKKSAKGRPSEATGFRTLGIRVTHEYAEWLASAAKHDRVTIAAFIDKAVADRAKAIGFDEPAPERLP
jgi:hypothetical protein